jgi:hypothetical protein
MWPLLIPCQVLTIELGPLDEGVRGKRSCSPWIFHTPRNPTKSLQSMKSPEVMSAEVNLDRWSKRTRGTRSESLRDLALRGIYVERSR